MQVRGVDGFFVSVPILRWGWAHFHASFFSLCFASFAPQEEKAPICFMFKLVSRQQPFVNEEHQRAVWGRLSQDCVLLIKTTLWIVSGISLGIRGQERENNVLPKVAQFVWHKIDNDRFGEETPENCTFFSTSWLRAEREGYCMSRWRGLSFGLFTAT